jgi:hypothetical protein
MATFKKGNVEIRSDVSDFKGKEYFSIREYYSKVGQFLPSPKGFSFELTSENITNFRHFLKEVNLQLKELEDRDG